MLHATRVDSVGEANTIHHALAPEMDPAMSCDLKNVFPPTAMVSAAVHREDYTLYAAYSDTTPIAGAIVVTGQENRYFGRVIWFYAAVGRHRDAVSVLTPLVVEDVGEPYGIVQNPQVAAAFQEGFADNVSTTGETLSWTGTASD